MWGSEEQTSLAFKWSKTVCLLNGLLFKPCLGQPTNSHYLNGKKFGNPMLFGYQTFYPGG